MIRNKQSGSIVTLICDSGERYKSTYLNETWITQKNLNIKPYIAMLDIKVFLEGHLLDTMNRTSK